MSFLSRNRLFRRYRYPEISKKSCILLSKTIRIASHLGFPLVQNRHYHDKRGEMSFKKAKFRKENATNVENWQAEFTLQLTVLDQTLECPTKHSKDHEIIPKGLNHQIFQTYRPLLCVEIDADQSQTRGRK